MSTEMKLKIKEICDKYGLPCSINLESEKNQDE